MRLFKAISVLAFVLPIAAFAADYPAPNQGEWTARDFVFHTGGLIQLGRGAEQAYCRDPTREIRLLD